MKKSIILLATVLLSVSAFAQTRDSNMFNHLSLGVSAGLDGIGANVAAPIGDHLGIRAGYSILPENLLKINYNAEINGTMETSERDIDLKTVAFSASPDLNNASVLLDIFPSAKSGFHFSVGAYFSIGGSPVKVKADLRADPTNPSNVYLTPEEYGHLFVSYNDLKRITTDEEGFAHADYIAGKVLPYVGIGFGRPVASNKRVNLTFDLGAMYNTDFHLQTYDSRENPVEITSASIDEKDNGLIDKYGKTPILPLLKFTLFVRLF